MKKISERSEYLVYKWEFFPNFTTVNYRENQQWKCGSSTNIGVETERLPPFNRPKTVEKSAQKIGKNIPDNVLHLHHQLTLSKSFFQRKLGVRIGWKPSATGNPGGGGRTTSTTITTTSSNGQHSLTFNQWLERVNTSIQFGRRWFYRR